MCIYYITPLAKGLCDTPLVLLTLKFHDLPPFLIYTPTPSVNAYPIFNCVVQVAQVVGVAGSTGGAGSTGSTGGRGSTGSTGGAGSTGSTCGTGG